MAGAGEERRAAGRRRTRSSQSGSDAAPTITLSGATPNGLQRRHQGIFQKRAELVNEHVSYVHAGDDGTLLWHAGAFWWVGQLKYLGEQRGYICAQDGSLDPASVEAGWEAWDDDSKQWRAAPGLRCQARTPAQISSDAAPTITLSGATPNGLQRQYQGIFQKRAELVNEHVSYVHAGDDGTLLWHAGAFWWVGTLAYLGEQRGYIRAQDGSLDPASVEAGWEAWDDDSKQWRAAPGLRCQARTPAQISSDAAPTITLSGATPNGLQRQYQGVFQKRAELVNEHVSYVHAGDDGTLLWHAGAFWWVGALADLGKQRGYIGAQDGSLDPASVEAGWWEAWDDDSKQWRAAPALQCALTPADDDEVQLVGERSRQEKDAELRKRAIDLEAESPADGKRAKADAQPSTSAAATAASTIDLAGVLGLSALLEHLSDAVQRAALAWCVENEVTAVVLICEAEAEDAFVDALPIKPTSIPAITLRKRLAKLRDRA